MKKTISVQPPREAGKSLAPLRGRPRKYGEGFRHVRNEFNKQLRLKTEVFTKWNSIKNTYRDTMGMSHSDFAMVLLDSFKTKRKIVHAEMRNQ